MKTTIDNNIRVLQIVTSTQTQVFCNPKDYKEIAKELNLVEGYYTVYHFWNSKQKKLSKKELKSLVESK